MNISREELLKTLELLPVWQLRTPNIINDSTKNVTNTAVKTAINRVDNVATVASPSVSLTQNTPVLEIYQSENKAWLFICPKSLTDNNLPDNNLPDNNLPDSLLNKIFAALHIKAKKHADEWASVDWAEISPKVIVVMGEEVAQNLLSSLDAIEQLRGKTYLLHNLPTVVTYSTDEILQHLPNKAKTWEDLCMALNIVNT